MSPLEYANAGNKYATYVTLVGIADIFSPLLNRGGDYSFHTFCFIHKITPVNDVLSVPGSRC